MFNRKNEEPTPKQHKLLEIEHTGFWLAFWGLFLSIYGQIALGSGGLEMIAGEGVLLVVLAVYLCVRCVKNGIWSRRFAPGFKTNLLLSAAVGLVLGGFWLAVSYRNEGNFQNALGAGVFMALMLAVAIFVVLTIAAGLAKKNQDDSPED